MTQTVPNPRPTGPVDGGPVTSAAGTCKVLAKQTVADDVGMRLARTTVQRIDGTQVGCTFYALQHSPLHNSERLPGPKQPAVRLRISHFADATAAHNAMVRAAEKGTNPQRAAIGGGLVGLAYQLRFYPADHGKDWACAVAVGAALAVVETVTTATSFDVVAVAKHLAKTLR